MKSLYLLPLFALLCNKVSIAQTTHKSIVQEEKEYYDKLSNKAEQKSNTSAKTITSTPLKQQPTSTNTCNLTKRTFGFHPYWMDSLSYNHQWNLLSDFCYFDYAINPSNGNNTNIKFRWDTSYVVTKAITNGVNVHFTATLFSNHSTFLGSTTAKNNFINKAITHLNNRNAKGLNIDFEQMTSTNSAAFTAFMINLCNQVHAANPNYQVTLDLPSVDFNNVFDITTLNQYVDAFIVMGYDYYYAGSTQAGPVTPLYNYLTGFNYTLSRSTSVYLNKGIPNSKLILAVPYYGREWQTQSGNVPSNTIASAPSKYYSFVKNNPSIYTPTAKKWEPNSFNPYYAYQSSGNWYQCWIDDVYSMGRKFDFINQMNVAGMGIWALGYDSGSNDYWDLIRNKFTTCAVIPCTDSIFDPGGPNRNYYDNQSFVYTIAPTGASQVSLNLRDVVLESGADSLKIYDGASTSAPLLGAYSTTLTTPITLTSTGDKMTVRFKSNGSNTRGGFRGVWNCIVNTDYISPTTQILTSGNWQTNNFNSTYVDADNSGGSGVKTGFYLVSDYNGTEWRANGNNGFFADDFGTAIHPEWTNKTGTWNITSQALVQTEETTTNAANTNIYAAVNQNSNNKFLYHFKGKIGGTGTARRAGFHFFCDKPDSSNRGNSYFVWFRVDNQKIQIYETVNNTSGNTFGSPKVDVAYSFTANQWYDYKVIYDKSTGKIDVYVNDVLSASWTDTTPLTLGSHISFRSGNAIWSVDELAVYRSRSTTTPISIGSANTNDVRYQNPSPAQNACKVKSLCADSAGNLSTISVSNINIDWTVPSTVSVNDGPSTDINTVNSVTTLEANWTASTDTHSGLAKYWYSIGTTPGSTNVSPWTSNSTNTSISINGLTLKQDTTYYINVKVENGAGLFSAVTSSNGQKVDTTSSTIGVNELENAYQLAVYPNPTKEILTVKLNLSKETNLNITLLDMLGKEIITNSHKEVSGSFSNTIDLQSLNLSKGMYLLRLSIGGNIITKKITKN